MKVRIALVLALIASMAGVTAEAVTREPAPRAAAAAHPAASAAETVIPRELFERPPTRASRSTSTARISPAVSKPASKPVVRKPAVKPVQKAAAPVARPTVVRGGATVQWARGAAGWVGYPAWVEQLGLCISHHESWSPRMWTAENPTSTASGGFQFIDGTFVVWAKRAGISAPRHAAYASPVIQVRVFAYTVTHGGKRAWNGTGCPGT